MSTSNEKRRDWMRQLALAGEGRLRAAWDALDHVPSYSLLRGPETGLVMVRARAGNTGRRFNLGEISVTRCTVRLDCGTVGHAWVSGVRPDHARLAAAFDALLQTAPADLEERVLEPLRQARQEQLARRRAEVEPTKVDFFTLVRGDE